MKNINILSIHGGGIKGIIPAVYLEYIENETNHRCKDLFHLISGTSTGGILASGLEFFSAAELKRFYLEKAKDMFVERSCIINPWSLFNSKYKTSPARNTLNDIFKSKRLNDISYNLLVPYYNITDNHQQFFKSHRARLDVNENYFLSDVILSTTAAPTYFKPYLLPYRGNQNYIDYTDMENINFIENETKNIHVIDGGVFANDPTLCAITEAIELYPYADSYNVFNIGTGGVNNENVRKKIPKTLLDWGCELPSIFMANINETDDHIIKELGKNFKKPINIINISTDIPYNLSNMDAVDNIRELEEIANKNVNDDINNKTKYRLVLSVNKLLEHPKYKENDILPDHNVRSLTEIL